MGINQRTADKQEVTSQKSFKMTNVSNLEDSMGVIGSSFKQGPNKKQNNLRVNKFASKQSG